jgi:hypothetical protein
MCKICNNENLEELRELYCYSCPLLTTIPYIENVKYLICSGCPLLTNIPNIKGLKQLWCDNCPLLSTIPQIKGLIYLNCSSCPLLKNIPYIEGLNRLNCSNCPLIKNISYIEGLKRLNCSNCPLLKNIPYIEGIQKITCCRYIDHIDLIYLSLSSYHEKICRPVKCCKSLVNKKMERMYNNIYYLWKRYKLNKYIKYLEINYYSNPQLPYMKYYIENELYNEDNKEFKIGYINNKEELIWYKMK